MANKEYFEIKGDQLVEKIEKLIAEGNVRKIIIKDKAGKELMSFPLSFGVAGALLAPMFAAIGAAAALMTECTIAVEREPQPGDKDNPGTEKPMD